MACAVRTVVLSTLLLCAASDKTRLRSHAKVPENIVAELGNVEKMVQSQLQGNPKIMNEELTLLHAAESSAHRSADIEAKKPPHATQLLQQRATEGLSKDANLLGMAESQIKQLLQGHPVEMQKEEQALNQAMSAARSLSKPRAAFVETHVKQTKSSSKTEVSAAMLEEQRSSSMATALHEKRRYATAEEKLAKEGHHTLSLFASVKDAIAQAFAGKDSNAVKTAMEVGEMVDAAQTHQQEVVKHTVAEAAKATQEVHAQEAAFAQMSAQSKEMQEQRAYTSGMAHLATTGKAILKGLSDLKGVVAEAFAGQDSKGVEKAMEVGELLDEAHREQQDVTQKDQKEAVGAAELFRQLRAMPHH